MATLLPSGAVTNQRVARELGMSQRTLARRLDNLGTSFGQILDGIRHQLALRYLGEPNARASQIAYLLGYSDGISITTRRPPLVSISTRTSVMP